MGLREQPVLNQVMLDLETLSTKSNAVILSIGAVMWNRTSIGDTFYCVLSDEDQQKIGRDISDTTLAWWAQQSPEAKKVFDAPRDTAQAALAAFSKWLGDGNLQIWGNGADFDNIILGSLYEDLGMKRPWSYSNNRCFRTLKNICLADNLPLREGTYHNALDDAVYQAKLAQKYLAGTIKP